MLAIEWYPELQKLPELVTQHVMTQLLPGGVLARRLAQPHTYSSDLENELLRSLDLARPGQCS